MIEREFSKNRVIENLSVEFNPSLTRNIRDEKMKTDLLAKLTSIPGPVGREREVQEFLKLHFERYGCKTRIDDIGNLIAELPGIDATGNLIITAHADEIGYIVSRIREDGIIFVHYNTGAANPDTRFLPGKDIVIYGDKSDVKGVIGFLSGHLSDPENKKKVGKIFDTFIDTGLTRGELEEKGVHIGSPVLLSSNFEILGNYVKTRALDDRVGLFVMIKLLEKLSKAAVEKRVPITFVSTVQEEIGTKGVAAVTKKWKDAVVIALDVGPAGGYPGSEEKTGIRIGKGPVLVYKDYMIHYNIDLINDIETVARENKITIQRAVYKNYGSDGAVFVSSGLKSALIAIPTRYTHSPIEMASLEDIEKTIELLVKFVINYSPR